MRYSPCQCFVSYRSEKKQFCSNFFDESDFDSISYSCTGISVNTTNNQNEIILTSCNAISHCLIGIRHWIVSELMKNETKKWYEKIALIKFLVEYWNLSSENVILYLLSFNIYIYNFLDSFFKTLYQIFAWIFHKYVHVNVCGNGRMRQMSQCFDGNNGDKWCFMKAYRFSSPIINASLDLHLRHSVLHTSNWLLFVFSVVCFIYFQ